MKASFLARNSVRFLLALACLAVVTACDSNNADRDCDCSPELDGVQESGLRLTLENAWDEDPGKVSVLFKVETSEGEPVSGLTGDLFQIYEDGVEVSSRESDQRIVGKPEQFVAHIVLLMDLSGSIMTESLDDLKDAAMQFVSTAMPGRGTPEYGEVQMSILWFDGERNIHRLTEPQADRNVLVAAIRQINPTISQDRSTNLYGGVIQGLNEVEKLISSEKNKVAVGTLVIFTDGTDQASWKTEEEALDAVAKTNPDQVSIYTVGLEGEVDQNVLQQLGRDQFLLADNVEELVPTFEAIANDIREDVNSHYLLEYCSPSRNGDHSLRLTLAQGDRSGSIMTCFCADGFSGECNLSSSRFLTAHKAAE